MLYLCVQIFSTLRRGHTHPVHCDDFLVQKRVNPTLWIGAVMDGCSSGTDSYFAATMIGKLISKIMATLHYTQAVGFDIEQADTSVILKYVAQALFKEVILAKNQLFLERNELLSTLIIAIYRPQILQLSLLAAGDGVFSINGETTVIEQQNKPNYLAYHLDKSFDEWYDGETITKHRMGVHGFAISTDGVESFTTEALTGEETDFDAIDYLLINQAMAENAAMLNKKCLIMEQEQGLIPRDDVAIIRIINR